MNLAAFLWIIALYLIFLFAKLNSQVKFSYNLLTFQNLRANLLAHFKEILFCKSLFYTPFYFKTEVIKMQKQFCQSTKRNFWQHIMYCLCNTPSFLVISTEFSASVLKEILININKSLQKKSFHLTLLKSPSLIYGLNISNRYLL